MAELHLDAEPINAAGYSLICSFEGCRLTAYKCPAGVWTIGFGSTGPHVRPGMRITQAAAEHLLREDLRKFEIAVSGMLKRKPTANQYAALVSFAFNCGASALARSTLLRKFNAGDVGSAAAEFMKWTRAKGKVLPGLVRRRKAEQALFLKA